jgi:hypothetical protein
MCNCSCTTTETATDHDGVDSGAHNHKYVQNFDQSQINTATGTRNPDHSSPLTNSHNNDATHASNDTQTQEGNSQNAADRNNATDRVSSTNAVPDKSGDFTDIHDSDQATPQVSAYGDNNSPTYASNWLALYNANWSPTAERDYDFALDSRARSTVGMSTAQRVRLA